MEEQLNGMSDKEILEYLNDSGIIDIEAILQEKEMKERKQILDNYPHQIWKGSNGRFCVYIDETDANGKEKRRLVSKKTIEEAEEAVITAYKLERQKLSTFDEFYWKWRETHDISLSGSSIAKYNTDHKRYFEGEKFVEKHIVDITEEDVKAFLINKTKALKLCRKATKTLFGYMYNTFKSACINHVLTANPMQFMEPKDFYKFCMEKKKPISTKTVSDEEMEKLYDRFYEDYDKHPSYITTYAVEFATLTGMRVGEIAGLSWDMINYDEGYILIDQSEKYNKMTKEFFIDGTKTGRTRLCPLTDEINDLLRRVKKAEMQYGYFCEWVFANENGRIHAPAISSCCKNKCRQVGIPDRGIHALRRTFNSNIKHNGASTKTAASILGHSEQVNEQCYTFDVATSDEKNRIVAEANAKMPHYS